MDLKFVAMIFIIVLCLILLSRSMGSTTPIYVGAGSIAASLFRGVGSTIKNSASQTQNHNENSNLDKSDLRKNATELSDNIEGLSENVEGPSENIEGSSENIEGGSSTELVAKYLDYQDGILQYDMPSVIEQYEQNTLSLTESTAKILKHVPKNTINLFNKIILNSVIHLHLMKNQVNDVSIKCLKRNAILLQQLQDLVAKKYPNFVTPYSESQLKSLAKKIGDVTAKAVPIKVYQNTSQEDLVIRLLLSGENLSGKQSHDSDKKIDELRDDLRKCQREKMELELENRKLKDNSSSSSFCEIMLRGCKDEKEELQRKIANLQRDLDSAKQRTSSVSSSDIENYKRQIVDLQNQNYNLNQRAQEIYQSQQRYVTEAQQYADGLRQCQYNLGECEANVASILSQVT